VVSRPIGVCTGRDYYLRGQRYGHNIPQLFQNGMSLLLGGFNPNEISEDVV
jgi:hypothetical protein